MYKTQQKYSLILHPKSIKMEVTPGFIFETSWEVCNKVGGIHTVITSKLPYLHSKYGNRVAFVGPDILKDSNASEFIEDKNLLADWRKIAEAEGLRIKIGHWNVAFKPMAILVDFTSFYQQKDEIFAHYWEKFQLDSLSGDWDYIESALFGYAAGKVIECYKKYLLFDTPVIAQFHEWQTGAGVLYLDENCPQVGTVFTTHATVLGRSIAGNGFPLYKSLGTFEPDIKAKELGVMAKHSLEKCAATNAAVFTTVSKVTADECEFILNNPPDTITPNGFALDHIPAISDEKVVQSRAILIKITEALTGAKCNDQTLFVAISGRYEYKNKGIDIFIDALGKLNRDNNLAHNIVGFIMVPNNHYGPRKELIEHLNHQTENPLTDRITTHVLNPDSYDPVIDKCHQLQLINRPDQKVNIIMVPVYLNGHDGIFNIPYYELLSGFDLTAFPSYYEPWGYTPLESIAIGVPTVTTSLSGFGQWMKKRTDGIEDGLAILERTEDNYWDVVEQLTNIIARVNLMNGLERKKLRQAAKTQSIETSWINFYPHYIEAYERALAFSLNRSDNRVINSNFLASMENKLTSNDPIWKKMIIHSDIPVHLRPLDEISNNLWWCWNYDAIELFEYINPKLWERCEKNPIALLKLVSSDRLAELETDQVFVSKLEKVYSRFTNYMNCPRKENMPLIGYFSMEYGLTDNLKIYSGGLGILAGDYLKEASDSNIPMVGIGLLYKFG